jgi:general secretion pathway protein F
MAAFEFTALTDKGKQKKGVIEGDTAKQVRQQLREQGMTPLSVDAVVMKQKMGEPNKSSPFSFEFKRSVSISDLSLLTRQLATLCRSGLPLEESIKAVADQSEKSYQKSMMMAVRSRVIEGHTLADGFSQFPHVFDQLFRSMVSAGEKSGHLDEVLERLAEYIERRQEIRQKITLAMIYPISMMVIATLVVSGLLAFVVPKIVDQFTNMGADLPQLTKIMIVASNFVRGYWWAVAIVITLLVIGVKALLSHPGRLKVWHRWFLGFPVMGKVSRDLNTARFASTLSILNSSGVPLLDGLKIASQVMSNTHLKEIVSDAAAKVREGASLGRSLAQTKQFPPMMLHMINSGEQSGELDQMLERAAETQDKQFEAQIAISLGIFQPIMVLIMGGLVFTIVLAVLMPIMQMNELMAS